MSRGLPTPRFDQDLPILARRDEIIAAIRDHQVLVVCGETGSGKSTQLPQLCLAAGRGRERLIAHTQPRRLAARAVARRIAEELAVPLGAAVGVKVRFADQTSDRTVIKLVTDGLLLAETRADPDLASYDTVIIDEAHERSLNIDFLLGYLRRLLPRRPDLRVIITSATIDPARFAAFFADAAPPPPVINVSGRTFPVEIRYRPPHDAEDFDEVESHAVVDAVAELCAPAVPPGDILVFLPGEREIRVCADALRRDGRPLDVLPLFARLTNDEQDRIFRRPPGAPRRVILATNVAETSLTIPGIRHVVDSGFARISRYDSRAKVQRLPIEPVSQASANQRSGRCGRVAAGVCIRLFSEASFRERPPFTEPEIRRTDLAGVALQMLDLDLGAIPDFPFIDPPDAASITHAYETLHELGAIPAVRERPTLTPLGAQLARLPVDPRIGRILLAGRSEGCPDEALILAAALSIQDPRERPASRQDDADRAQAVFRHESSDFITLLRAWEQYRHAESTMSAGPLRAWCREHFLSAERMREWADTVRQLRDVVDDLNLPTPAAPRPPDDDARERALHRALLTGLIANVCCRDEALGPYEYRGFRGNVVSIFPGSVLFKKNPRWFVAAEIVQTTRLYARTLARVDPAWLEDLAGHLLLRQLADRHFDPDSGAAAAWERLSFAGIVVVPRRRVPLAPIDPPAAREIFLREALAAARLNADLPFLAHNRRVLEHARTAEAKLRRRAVLRDPAELAAWFAARLPASVNDPASLAHWCARHDPSPLRLSPADVLTPHAAPAADPHLFPDSITLADASLAPLEYRFEPGKDADGLTLTLRLLQLPLLPPHRPDWLVPGLLPDLITSRIKSLPRPLRAALEAHGPPASLASDLAGVLSFAQGSLHAALSEAAAALFSTTIPPDAWSAAALPDHLRLRIRITDDAGHELGVSRDAPELRARLATRLARAQAAESRARFERDDITSWDFGDLPDSLTIDRGGAPARVFPVLLDAGDAARLSLADDPVSAERETARGVRRLAAIACAQELTHRLAALPNWKDLAAWYKALGPEDELRDALTCLIAERCFLAGQPPIRSREAFEQRLQDRWGRLAQLTSDVVPVLAAMLEPRFRVAQRISGGTPRLWAASVADIREQAVYLMPRGFLLNAPWERLREFPRYVEAMRQRLFSLREEGSGVESAALRQLLPHWKKFTAWVAARMSEERARAESAPAPTPPQPARAKAPLPQARRAAPAVNLDAGEWAAQPGRLPPDVEAFRWAIEDARVTLLAPALAGPRVSVDDLARLARRF